MWAAAAVLVACGSKSSNGSHGAAEGGALEDGGSSGSGSSSGNSSGGSSGGSDGGDVGEAGAVGDATSTSSSSSGGSGDAEQPETGAPPHDAALLDAPALPASLACTLPFGAADTSNPTTVVGSAAHPCTEAGLASAVQGGGIITFDCGNPTTITLTAQLEPPTGKDTTIDGGGTVTLDGGGTTRILFFNGGGYRTTSTVITLQNLTFQHGHATGTAIPLATAPCSQGYSTDAGGGAVQIEDGVLDVIDCTFNDNSGESPGPDVAGGAIYVNGCEQATIIGSRFANNTCSNGGAVGSLNSDLAIYTSTMNGNTATGTGQNNTSSMCNTASQEIGDGGSGGAVYMDGGQDGNTVFCGDTFSSNHANALGGAIFRVFDDATHDVDMNVCTVDSNVADGPVGTDGAGPGAGAFYFHNTNLNIDDSTISNNSSPGCGGLQADSTTLAFSNVTLSGNVASDGVGGAICIFSNGGTLTNCTLAGNQANAPTGEDASTYGNFYGAAIFGGGLTLDNCIVANDTTDNPLARMACANTETGAHDVQWPMDKSAGGGTDTPCVTGITFSDPMLSPLANNGGPTSTMIPAAAASVVQVGTGCPATDQTGKPRANPCTIGAFEK